VPLLLTTLVLLAYLLMSLGSGDPFSVAFAVVVDSAVADVPPRVPSVVVVSTIMLAAVLSLTCC
jgi:hypothetical protein